MAKLKHSDPNGRHVRVYCTLLNSHAWRVLGWSARALFMDLRAGVMATNNGNISATLETLAHRGWRHPATLAGALFELQAAGFLVKTRGASVNQGGRQCALYAFTDLDVYPHQKLGVEASKASHAYQRYATLADAEMEIAAAVEKLRDASRQHFHQNRARHSKDEARKKTSIHFLNRDRSVSEAQETINRSVSEAWTPPTVQKLKHEKQESNHAEARAA